MQARTGRHPKTLSISRLHFGGPFKTLLNFPTTLQADQLKSVPTAHQTTRFPSEAKLVGLKFTKSPKAETMLVKYRPLKTGGDQQKPGQILIFGYPVPSEAELRSLGFTKSPKAEKHPLTGAVI